MKRPMLIIAAIALILGSVSSQFGGNVRYNNCLSRYCTGGTGCYPCRETIGPRPRCAFINRRWTCDWNVSIPDNP
ncbi:unnamed protein product [Allacma fusca]|uniref:Uncharacterized protein n=1 Tax=Allacma fusca TaxID=39272 RepID=A0A8J2J9E9_9HEXA|nr:unnamed protein product [Allacma fusca]